MKSRTDSLIARLACAAALVGVLWLSAAEADTVRRIPPPPAAPAAPDDDAAEAAAAQAWVESRLAEHARQRAAWESAEPQAVSKGGAGETSSPSAQLASNLFRPRAETAGNTVERPHEAPLHTGQGTMRLTAFQDPPPIQPEQPEQPEIVEPLDPLGGGFAAFRRSADPTVTESLPPLPTRPTAPSSVGAELAEASTVQSVKMRQRSSISLDPNIRGYRDGQIYMQANGSYWMPARTDLDSVFGRTDPGVVESVDVIAGPYGLRYGPGFAFLNIERTPTPRYAAPQTDVDLTGNVRTNGGQLYGRGTVLGGGQDYGYRLSYGHRYGEDYKAGDGTRIPSRYRSRDVWGEIGWDVGADRTISFAYNRLDQTDTRYAEQFFDIDFLVSNGFEVRYVDTDAFAPWTRFDTTLWYNNTHFVGNTENKRNPNFPIMQRVEWALDEHFGRAPGPGPDDTTARVTGQTWGATETGGMRGAFRFGELDELHLRVGGDVRHIQQRIDERLTETPDFPGETIKTNMPRSWLTNPGVYAEFREPVTDRWTAALGGRFDYAATRARVADLREGSMLPGGDDFLRQNDFLHSYYVTSDYELTSALTAHAKFGYAQRPPTLIERYADGMFLSMVQSGFTRVIGDPQLTPERNWQFDFGLSVEQDTWRGRATYYHAWISDYVTFFDDGVSRFGDARLLRYMNTPLATLTGFELYGEFNVLPRLTLFGEMSYVEGTDRDIGRPLPSISPLEGTTGLRLHDLQRGQRWGIELAARMVTSQNRLGVIRMGDTLTTLEERTGGFTTWKLRGYYNYTRNFHLIAGIDNLFDRTYQEHLDGRVLGPDGFPPPATRVLRPGFSPYFGLRWVF